MNARLSSLGAVAAMLFGLAAMPGYARKADSAKGTQANAQARTFVGELEGTNENREWVDFILYDTTRNTNFYIDDDWKAAPYIGHQVKITGTLDPKNAIIHVQSIEGLN